MDLENFATASSQYTGDIHNSTVVGLFMTPVDNESGSKVSQLSAHVCYTPAHLNSPNFITSICSGLVVQVVSALLLGTWQGFN